MSKVNNKSGFTLIETFVAITILVIAVLGPMSLLSNSLQNSRYIKDEIVASFLAQEGVELMLFDRNSNSGNLLVVGQVPDYSCEPLKWSPTYGYNCINDGEPTIFTRKVEVMVEDPATNQYEVVSTVTRSNTIPPNKSIVSRSVIFNY